MQKPEDSYVNQTKNRHDEDIPAHVGEERVPKTTHVVCHLHGLHGEEQRVGFVVEQVGNQPNIRKKMGYDSPPIAFGDKDERAKKKNRRNLPSPETYELGRVLPQRGDEDAMEARPMENHGFEEKNKDEENEYCPCRAVALGEPCTEAR